MKVDPRRDGMLRCVIHELLHIDLRDQMKIDVYFGENMEEATIMALETYLFKYIQTRPIILESWERAIKRKLINDPIG